MITVKRQGSIENAIAALRGIPERVIPYASATALTRTAKAAQSAVVQQMSQVFDAPTPYTLNSTYVEPASVAKPVARVAVKNMAGGATAPEHYLLPEVEGGARRVKRFESALRYAGVLGAGKYAVAGRDAPRDAYGNLQRADISGALGALAARGDGRRTRARRGVSYFIAGRLGVFKRQGKSVTGILIFVSRPPAYTKRLDFEAIARDAVQERFADEFAAAAAALMSRRPS